jgi:hypothetical protein
MMEERTRIITMVGRSHAMSLVAASALIANAESETKNRARDVRDVKKELRDQKPKQAPRAERRNKQFGRKITKANYLRG